MTSCAPLHSRTALALLAALALAGPLHAATRIVANGNDSGLGSLRQTLANAVPGDVITFSALVTQVSLNSPLEITQNISITGPGVTLDGQLKGRVLHVAAGASATLQGLTITRGLLAGKGIDLHGSADSGSSWGAGIRNDGALVLDGVQVVGNYATGGGGGGGSTYGGGGGGGSGVRVSLGGGAPLYGAGGDGGVGISFLGGSGASASPTGGAGPSVGGNGSNGGGAGGGGGGGGSGGSHSGGGGGGWAGGGGGGGWFGGGGGGYGGAGGDLSGGAGSDGSTGGGPTYVDGGSGGSPGPGGDAAFHGEGGGGGYIALGGVWLGGGGGAGQSSSSNGGAAVGGIYNAAGATLTVQGAGCAISANLAAGGGGGGGQGGGQAVGGLWSDGALNITTACQAAISGNAAGAGRNGTGTGPAASNNDLRGTVSTILGLGVTVTGGGNVSAVAGPTPFSGAINVCTNAGGAVCTANYVKTTPAGSVTLTASAAPGQAFAVQWGGACSGTASTCTVTMDQARAVTAAFTWLYPITASANPSAGGSVACTPNPAPHGSTSTCSVTTNAGYTFTGWSGDCSGSGACTLANVTAAKSVTASFALNTYPITASANPAAGGSVACTHNPAPHGSTSTCSVTTNAGYTFTGWSGDCSGSGACSLTNVTAAKSVTASFAPVITSFSGTNVPPGGAGGPATAQFTGGGPACRFDMASTAFVAAPAAPPPGQLLPQGMFQFKLIGCDTTPVNMSVTWPKPVSGLTKWGAASAGAAPSYFAPDGLSVSANTTSFTVIDGQKGDDDWAVNGTIVDPVGPTISAEVAPVPTLSQWALLLLGLLAAGLGAWGLRRRAC